MVGRRITITFSSSEIADDLERWADSEGRPPANLAAYLLEMAIRIKYPEKYPPRESDIKGKPDED